MAMAAQWMDPVRSGAAFSESTGGTLLVGRVVPFRGSGEQLLERWDRWSARLPEEARLVPAHDLSRFEEYVGLDGWYRVALGIEIATAYADGGPSLPFGQRAIADADARARVALGGDFFDRIAEDLAATDVWALRTQRTRALLVPFGPIASARLAYGAIASTRERPGPGLARVRGLDMRSMPHHLAVDGTLVASASDWDVVDADLGAEAHDARARPGSAYHVVARYG